MSTAMDIILLERIDNLGEMGDVVNVRAGYARNYLLPQNKALRANENNRAYFEAQRAVLEKRNNEKKKEAEKDAKKIDGLTVNLIRHASENGNLYGSVAARDIAEAITGAVGDVQIRRGQVIINQAVKTIGLFPIEIALHPEVKVTVTINIARSEDEAKTQLKTGKALIVDNAEEETAEKAKPAAEEESSAEIKKKLLEESALEAEVEAAKEEEAKKAKEAKKAAEKKSRKEAKKAEDTEETSEDLAETETAEIPEDQKAETEETETDEKTEK